MKCSVFIAGLALTSLVCGCDVSSTSSSGSTSSSSSSSSGERKEVTLSGTAGHAEAAGDKIDLKEGTVFVNGVSFGPVPPGATVRYVVTPTARELRVAGELRTASK